MGNMNLTPFAAAFATITTQSYDYTPLKSVARTFEDAQSARLSIQNRLLQHAASLRGIDVLKRNVDKDEEEKAAKAGAEARDQLVADFNAVVATVRDKRATAASKAADAAARKSVLAALTTAGITDKDTIKSATTAALETARPERVERSIADIPLSTLAAAVAETTLPHGILSQAGELLNVTLSLCRQLADSDEFEARASRSLESALRDAPIYREFLANVKGIGPSMAGSLLANIDIHKSQYASSLWAYAGLDVGPDGRGRSRRAEHLVEVNYTDKEGKAATRKGLSFNPDLKTTLFLCATSFLKVGVERSPYAKVYYDTKTRLENHAIYGVHNDGKEVEGKGRIQPNRRHMMGMRAAQKRFLVDLYKAWRALEGLPVAPEYSEAKLSMTHGSADKYRVAA